MFAMATQNYRIIADLAFRSLFLVEFNPGYN